MAKTITLFDAFTTKDTTKWYWESNASVSAGQLRLVPNTAYGKIGTNTTYDLSGSSATIRLVQLPNVGNGSIQTTFILSLGASQDLGFNIANRTVELWGSGAASIPYNATDHAWLRVREAGGTVYWETSADGIVWQLRASRANPFAVTALNVTISAGYSGTEGSPGVAIYDNFNLPPAASLVDDFNSADTTKWVFPASATVTGGQLQLVPTTNYDSVYSVGRYDLTGSSYGINVVQRANVGNGGIGLFLSVDAGSSNSLQFTIEGTGLNFRSTVGGTPSNTSITFDPVAHRFLRIREASGTIYWETSPDRITWTSRRTLANPFAVTSCNLQVSAGYYGTEPSLGVAIVDNVNGIRKADSARDDFATKDTTKWTYPTNASVVSGQLNLSLSTTYQGIYSTSPVDLTSSAVFLEVIQRPNIGNGTTSLTLTAELVSGTYVQILVENNGLILRRSINSVNSDVYIAWNAFVHRFWRIREAGGQVFWETSPDMFNWTIRRQEASQFPLFKVNLGVATGYYGTEPSPGTAIVDNLNCFKIEKLKDDFTTKDTAKFYFDPAVSVTSGRVQTPCSNAYPSFFTQATYDLTNSAVAVEFVQTPNVGNGTTEVYFISEVSAGNDFGFLWRNNVLSMTETVNNATNSTTTTYNATSHRWLRLREAVGTIYWDTSPDGITWTNRRSKTTTLNLTAVKANMITGLNGSETTPGFSIFDNFNVTVPRVSKLTDNFDTADGAKWYYAASATVTAGRLSLLPNTGYQGLFSVGFFDLTSSQAALEVVQRQNAGNGTIQMFISLRNNGNTSRVETLVEVNSIVFRQTVDGTTTDVNLTWDQVAHRWWRIREAAGFIYWDTSADGLNWIVRRQEVVAFDATQMNVVLGAGYYGTEPVLTSGVMDNFNLPPTRAARTYYLSNSGSDAADGLTSSTPWQTITRLNSEALIAGDLIRFNGGQTFSGGVTLNNSENGTSSAPITFESYGAGRATITNTSSAFTLSNSSGVVIRNLVLAGGSGAMSAGAGIAANSSASFFLDYLRLDNVDISAFRSGVQMSAATMGFRDVDINNCDLRANRDYGLWIYGPGFNAASPSYAHKNIRVGSSRLFGNTGQASSSSRSGTGLSASSVEAMTVEDCVAYSNGALANGSGGGAQGFLFFDSTTIVVQRCVAYSHRDPGVVDGTAFNLNENVSNSTLQYNIAYDNDGCGFQFYSYTDNGSHYNNTVRFNIGWGNAVKNNWRGEVWVDGNPVDLRFYNNTFVAVDNVNGFPAAIRFKSGKSGISFRNNIIVSGTGACVSAEVPVPTSVVVFQGNIYRPVYDNVVNVQGSSYSTIEAFRSGAGQEKIGTDATGLLADPGLVSKGTTPAVLVPSNLSPANNMKLITGSVATISGLDLQSRFGLDPGTRDFFGNTLLTPSSVGAFQDPAVQAPTWMLDSISMS